MKDDAETFSKLTPRMLAAVRAGELSCDALVLYHVLLSYENRKRGDRAVWPSRESLAESLALKQVRSVDKYVTELEVAGWVVVERRREGRTKTRNRYVLRGPSMEIVQWTALSKASEAVQSTAPSAQVGENVNSAMQRTEIVQSTALSIVQWTAPELDGREPDRREPDEASAVASSSSANAAKPAAPRRDEDDDEAREKRINKRRAAEARKATTEVIRRLGINRDEARLLIDYLVENAEDEGAPIRNIAAFVDACPNEDLDAHLDEARCRLEPSAPDHPDWVVEVKRVRTELERLEPDMNGVELDAIAAAHLAAFRRGCRVDEPVPAINGARHSDVRDPVARAAACIAALNALADVWATA